MRRETALGKTRLTFSFRRQASPRGAKGTSLVVAGLTPGAAYAFRVQTSSAPKDAEDKDAVSGVAVANAQRSRGDPDARDAGVAGLNFYEKDVAATPALRFCGATADAFPNGTALLFSEHTPSAAACCLACAETAGCNAWAHGGRGASFFEKKENEKKENESVAAPDAAENGACWLMYAPPYEPSTQKTQNNATLTNVTFLSTTPGGGWVGGVLDPSSAAPPAAPTGLALVDASGGPDAPPLDEDDLSFDAYFPRESLERLRRTVCVAWDPAPPLPAPIAAERSAVTRYIVRTTSALGTKKQTFFENGGDDGGFRDALETEREADLPPLLCACDGWRVPEPDGGRDGNGIVSITVRVVAENDAGRSKPASLVVEVPFLVARALAAATPNGR